MSQQVDTFFVKKDSKENHVLLAEIVHIYNNVRHNLSYNSMDCNLKLLKKMIPDSDISKKICCGRTKATMIVENVLAPFVMNNLISYLTSNNVYFGIQTDASNRKNRKFFPVCIQYFDKVDGIQNRILDFAENSDESAMGMFNMVQKVLESLKLDIKNVVCLSADNTNSNFGKHNYPARPES